MVSYLVESFRRIQQLLSEADFAESFPDIFGKPNEENAEVSVRNECGLLIRKAQMHINAVLRANRSNNLHSLAVHMRVVLECAAQVLSKAHAACDGSPKELARILNASESDFRYAMTRFSRGKIDNDQIQKMINSARKGIGHNDSRPPRRVTISDKISQLNGGAEWYRHLSKSFCYSKASVLASISFYGGVISQGTEKDDFAFAALLDYLTEQVISMLFGYGFLMIAVNGDSQQFDELGLFLDQKRSVTRSFRKSG